MGVQCEVKVSVAFSIQPDNVQIDVKNNVNVNVDDNVDVNFLQVQPSFDLALTVLPRESGKLIFLSWRYLCLNRGYTQFLRKTTGIKTFLGNATADNLGANLEFVTNDILVKKFWVCVNLL